MKEIHIPQHTQQTLVHESIKSCRIVVEEGGQLNLITLQLSPASEAAQREIVLHEGASVKLFTALFDSTEVTTEAKLEGNNTSYDHAVLYFGSAKQKINIITNSQHTGKETLARTRVRGVVIDSAQVNFRGSIDVEHGGSTNGSSLTHEGILLSKKGRIDALPGLEVATNDVKAAHSSAVHYIRPEQLFYLQCRGLPEQDARKLIVAGFTQELLNELQDAAVIKQLEAILEQKQSVL